MATQGQGDKVRDERVYEAWIKSGRTLTMQQLAERFGLSRGGVGHALRRMKHLKEGKR
jgi:DNA-binding GntR family transcriptional regulator